MKLNYLFLLIPFLFITCSENEMDDMNDIQSKQNLKTISEFNLDLAYYHAPIFYQDTDITGSHGLNGKADYITNYDYDGDLNATNNWNNLANNNYAINGNAYFSVVETETHYYIVYAFFHPRDWTDVFFLYSLDEHENDLEGALAIVTKDGSEFGKLQAVVTTYHHDFYSYNVANSGLTSGNESIDGTISFGNDNTINRFEISSEAKGHGIKSYATQKPGGGDYLIYYPSKTMGEMPENANDRKVKYKLVDIFANSGMWDQRNNTNLFQNGVAFKSSYGDGNANTPWNWNDQNDGDGPGSNPGDFGKYPADLADLYFNGFSTISKVYINNKYLGISN